jgi:hypothetical protein
MLFNISELYDHIKLTSTLFSIKNIVKLYIAPTLYTSNQSNSNNPNKI